MSGIFKNIFLAPGYVINFFLHSSELERNVKEKNLAGYELEIERQIKYKSARLWFLSLVFWSLLIWVVVVNLLPDDHPAPAPAPAPASISAPITVQSTNQHQESSSTVNISAPDPTIANAPAIQLPAPSVVDNTPVTSTVECDKANAGQEKCATGSATQ